MNNVSIGKGVRGCTPFEFKNYLDSVVYLKCQTCGYSNCVAALQFHHRDPNEKDFGLSHKGMPHSWEKTKKELNKCDLLCANCHFELHHPKIKNSTP